MGIGSVGRGVGVGGGYRGGEPLKRITAVTFTYVAVFVAVIISIPSPTSPSPSTTPP